MIRILLATLVIAASVTLSCFMVTSFTGQLLIGPLGMLTGLTLSRILQ